ncbi:MAG: hypothetical protein JWO87_3435, partial [Phycisphaerales bacterium]|nr:hypothetical protein [Phycisphaerales bacterium]
MQKVVKMLEQHVQWVALALGVIYLGWMVYSYVITPPVTVKLGTGPELYTPGTADEAIWRLQGLPLEAEINSKEEIHVKPKDMAGELFAKLKEENAKPTALATNWPVHLRYRPESGTQVAPAAGPTIVSLPQVPAPVLVAVSNYVTTVLSPAAGAAAAPVAGAPGAGAAAPGAGAGAAPPTPIRKDINYVSCLYKIDKDALGKAFKDSFAKAGIPVLFETMFLEVEFYREEQDPADGKWGQPVLMATLPIYELMKYPGDQVPANPALQVPYFTFADWAAVNQEIIARPAFFETAPDAPAWLFPGETPPEVAPMAGAGGPAVPPARALEEKKRWMEAHRPMQPRGTGRPGMPYPGRPGMPPGPGSYYRPGGPGAPGSAVPPVRTL